MKNLNDFVKVSVRSRQGRKPKVSLSIFLGGLAASASLLGLLAGCSVANEDADVKTEQNSGGNTQSSAVDVSKGESSAMEKVSFTEEDAAKYKTFLMTLQDKYRKEGIKIDKSDIKDLAEKYYTLQTNINANLVADDMSVKLVSSTNQTANMIEDKMTEPDDNYTKLSDSLEQESKQLKIVHKIILDCKAVEVGKTEKLNVTVMPAEADYALTYSSSDTSVLTIDNEGVMTGVKRGKATVTVSDENGVTSFIRVEVIGYSAVVSKPSEESSKPSTDNGGKGETSEQSSTVESSKPNTTVETSKPNTTTETSKPSTPVETSKPSTPVETPKPSTIDVTSISLNKSSLSLTVGDKTTLKATISPSNATNKSYSFSSSDNSVATVNSNGTVVAKGKGSCTITVKSSNGKSAKCSVTVKAKASTGNNTSGNNGGTSSTGDKGIASIPAGAKSYQTKSYNGKKTYTVYECPEVVKYINEYRKKAGLKEVKWNTLDYMNQHAYDTVFSIPKEVEYVKRYDPETYEKAFDKNGNYVGAYDYNDWFDATQNNRNAVAYMLGTNAIYHADEHQWSAGIQFTGGSKFSPSSWISNMKTSPDHWEMIMCEDATAVYCTYGVTSNGYFYVAISMI